MSRTERISSISGYYHLIIRGNGKQILFEEREDYQCFLSLLHRYSRKREVRINAYCLMPNHVHLLVRDQPAHKSDMMHDIALQYALYYNEKYDHCGHLFQGRFRSEAIHSERQLLTVFRYILNNPAKAGICAAESYEWSSYWQYGKADTLTDTVDICRMLGEWVAYQRFVMAANEDECLEFRQESRRKDDAWAQKVIREQLGLDYGFLLKTLPKIQRDEAIRTLKKAGLSGSQITRLTGIGRNIVSRA